MRHKVSSKYFILPGCLRGCQTYAQNYKHVLPSVLSKFLFTRERWGRRGMERERRDEEGRQKGRGREREYHHVYFYPEEPQCTKHNVAYL